MRFNINKMVQNKKAQFAMESTFYKSLTKRGLTPSRPNKKAQFAMESTFYKSLTKRGLTPSRPNKKAQFAMEYLLVIGLLSLLVIPGIYIYYNYSQSALTEINQAKVNDIGNEIISNAESAYYLGRGSRITLDVSVPSGVYGLEINCNDGVPETYCELNFQLSEDETRPKDVSFSTNVPLKIKGNNEAYPQVFEDDDYAQGKKKVVITVVSNFVEINIE